jgi:hypothetical protein
MKLSITKKRLSTNQNNRTYHCRIILLCNVCWDNKISVAKITLNFRWKLPNSSLGSRVSPRSNIKKQVVLWSTTLAKTTNNNNTITVAELHIYVYNLVLERYLEDKLYSPAWRTPPSSVRARGLIRLNNPSKCLCSVKKQQEKETLTGIEFWSMKILSDRMISEF